MSEKRAAIANYVAAASSPDGEGSLALADRTDVRFSFSASLFGQHSEMLLDAVPDGNLLADVLREVQIGKGAAFTAPTPNALTHEPGSPSILVHDDHDCKCNASFPFGYAVNNSEGVTVFENFGNCGVCPCSCGTREATMETIEMLMCGGLAAAEGGTCDMTRHPQSITATAGGQLSPMVWVEGAFRLLLIFTDEDSDCAFWPGNRGDVNCREAPSLGSFPSAPTGNAAVDIFLNEVVGAHDALVGVNASLAIFVDPSAGASRAQYGDPAHQVHDAGTYANFDATATLAAYQADATSAGSLHARLLETALATDGLNPQHYRLFDVDQLDPNEPAQVARMLDEIISSVADECAVPTPVPTPLPPGATVPPTAKPTPVPLTRTTTNTGGGIGGTTGDGSDTTAQTTTGDAGGPSSGTPAPEGGPGGEGGSGTSGDDDDSGNGGGEGEADDGGVVGDTPFTNPTVVGGALGACGCLLCLAAAGATQRRHRSKRALLHGREGNSDEFEIVPLPGRSAALPPSLVRPQHQRRGSSARALRASPWGLDVARASADSLGNRPSRRGSRAPLANLNSNTPAPPKPTRPSYA
jgi:hypothetical protein